MSSKVVTIALAAVVFASVGCSGVWVQEEVYKRDVGQLREYNQALERDNAELRAKADAYDKLRMEMDVTGGDFAMRDQIAQNLLKALEGMGVDKGDIIIGSKGEIILATDLLFNLGSWTVTSKGHEILSKFAQAQVGSTLKIVGHTDRKPIVRKKTKDGLMTDTNKELSVKRAVAVMGALMKNGFRESQFSSIEGHGSDEPRSKSNRANRRVEIFIVSGSGAANTSFQK